MEKTAKKSITVSFMAENAFYLEGLKKIVSSIENFEVLSGTQNLEEFLRSLKEAEVPDICLLNINIHRQKSRQLIESLKKEYPLMKILILSNQDHPYSIVKSFHCGAHGHLSKNTSRANLHRALLTVYFTGIYYNKSLLNEEMVSKDEDQLIITEMELEVLRCFCSELSYNEIADLLGLNLETIKAYKEVLFQKLHVESRESMVVLAFRIGLIQPSDLKPEPKTKKLTYKEKTDF